MAGTQKESRESAPLPWCFTALVLHGFGAPAPRRCTPGPSSDKAPARGSPKPTGHGLADGDDVSVSPAAGRDSFAHIRLVDAHAVAQSSSRNTKSTLVVPIMAELTRLGLAPDC
jgi:hypothetical protein